MKTETGNRLERRETGASRSWGAKPTKEKIMKTIEIKTALHEGIYKSSGGGETRTHYTWNLGPRNLLKAIEMLEEHSDSMTRGYGNIGHGGSWIEVVGVRMLTVDIDACMDPSFGDSKTTACKEFIAGCLDGSVIEDRRRLNEFQRERDEEQAAKDSDRMEREYREGAEFERQRREAEEQECRE